MIDDDPVAARAVRRDVLEAALAEARQVHAEAAYAAETGAGDGKALDRATAALRAAGDRLAALDAAGREAEARAAAVAVAQRNAARAAARAVVESELAIRETVAGEIDAALALLGEAARRYDAAGAAIATALRPFADAFGGATALADAIETVRPPMRRERIILGGLLARAGLDLGRVDCRAAALRVGDKGFAARVAARRRRVADTLAPLGGAVR
ncbi:hypothetical protein [Sphingomonas sanxanigenens]|uniref:Uncharacterized protein n=1 Tax=Sphingomonas sanxanigenens DSM 19645 = NX02 TaxID=1123269 RepID=W0AA86_9SPHN|nr:hypothetical protein [Sphingomonas sanxanigenens]AHE52570.1 hypothetical protein NX02_04100 [Sphingomonas sanxanigenens DSM 19645 = NX02]